MKLSAPKQLTWLVALVAGALGVIAHYRIVQVPVVGPYAIVLLVGAWALLMLATFVKGL